MRFADLAPTIEHEHAVHARRFAGLQLCEPSFLPLSKRVVEAQLMIV
jgi:hypothetical protein